MTGVAFDPAQGRVYASATGATPVLAFDRTGKPGTLTGFAGVTNPTGIAFVPNVICPPFVPGLCAGLAFSYSSGGTGYVATYLDDGTLPRYTTDPLPLGTFAPATVASDPSQHYGVIGTYNGNRIACILTPSFSSFTPSAQNCIMSGLTSAGSIATDNPTPSGPWPLWLAGETGGLTYGTYSTPGQPGFSPQISTSIAFPPPSGASAYSAVTLAY